ncbi:hypothetical protein [Salinicoccus sp. Marseille-QA3877]
MKTTKLFLLGVSMMILAGCGGESEETNENSEEGMGTLSAETEESNEPEADNTSESEAESTEEDPTHDTGLLDLSDNEEGWLNYEGDVGGNNEYRITPKIDYNPNKNYEINKGAYVTYYSGDEFIKTVQQAEGLIEQVENADNIQVSYHNSFRNTISLSEQ